MNDLVYFTTGGEMRIEPCPKPVTEWGNELGEFLPPGADAVASGADALVTLVNSAVEGLPQHDMELYVTNLQAVVEANGG